MTKIVDVVGVRPGTRIRFLVDRPPETVTVYSMNTQRISDERAEDVHRWLPKELEDEGGAMVVGREKASHSVVLAAMVEDAVSPVTMRVTVQYEPPPPIAQTYRITLVESVSAFQWVFVVAPPEVVH
jgi:hypothetical protein